MQRSGQNRSGQRWIARWALVTWIGVVAATAGAADLTPEETVKNYLAAVKAGNFRDAYQYVSKGMAQSKNQEEWAKEQQWVMQFSEAKIFEFHVYPGKVEGAKAFVPNVLNSQDKFLNQLGVEEQELYTLVREDGKWKIDQQQLVERPDLPKWFPPEVTGKSP
jgi:hypothetical protein